MTHKHTIAVIDANIQKDPVLMETMKLLFNWANEQALGGIIVNNLQFEEHNTPLGSKIYCNCEMIKQIKQTKDFYDKEHNVFTRFVSKWFPLDHMPYNDQLILVLIENSLPKVKKYKIHAKYPYGIRKHKILGWMPIPYPTDFYKAVD